MTSGRPVRRSPSVVSYTLLSACLVSGGELAIAQQPAAQGQRPAPQAMQVSVALDQVLQKWEQFSGQIKRMQGTHDRYEYKKSMGLEVRAKGDYYFEAPDRGRIDINPIDIDDGAVGKVPGMNGQPMRLSSADKETWISDGTQVLQLVETDNTKHYSRIEIPPQMRGANVADGPLPFLFGVSAEKMKARYRMELGSMHQWDPEKKAGTVHIVAYPTRKSDAQNWQRAEVLLDGRYFLPTAIRLRHGVGANADETVYVFKLTNETCYVNKKWQTDGLRNLIPGITFDPFKPSLRGYKLLEDHKIQQTSGIDPRMPGK